MSSQASAWNVTSMETRSRSALGVTRSTPIVSTLTSLVITVVRWCAYSLRNSSAQMAAQTNVMIPPAVDPMT